MALFPMVANFDGDFVLKLVPVDTENTMAEVAEAAASHAVGMHVAEQPGKTIYARRPGASEPFPLNARLSETDIRPMECIDFYYSD